MKLTSKTLFTFSKPILSFENDASGSDDHHKKTMALIRSPIFTKFMESLNTKTPDQDYDRFLGLIYLINTNIDKLPKQKKAFQEILSPGYLKGIPEDDIRDKVYDDLFKVYEELKKAMTKG